MSEQDGKTESNNGRDTLQGVSKVYVPQGIVPPYFRNKACIHPEWHNVVPPICKTCGYRDEDNNGDGEVDSDEDSGFDPKLLATISSYIKKGLLDDVLLEAVNRSRRQKAWREFNSDRD